MDFKVGNKVKVTKQLLLKLPHYFVGEVKNGGVITAIYSRTDEAQVSFYSGCTYNIFFRSLELVKNQQLEFDFMI